MRKVFFAGLITIGIATSSLGFDAVAQQPSGSPSSNSSSGAPLPSLPQTSPMPSPQPSTSRPEPNSSPAAPTSPAAQLPVEPPAPSPNSAQPPTTAPKPTPANDTTGKTAAKPVIDPENTLVMELKDGRVLIALRPDLAPKNVARIKELTRKNFYNGLVFHRVIPAFIAQGGDPKGDGSGGTGVSLDAEFSNEPHVRGVVSMARKPDDVNSADSQFFIVIGEAAPQLDGQYTVIGKVVEGMDHVMRIRKGSRALNGSVHNPDKIIKMTVLADEQKTGTVKK